MIPKIIHYCWFGDKKLDSKAIRCINSWKKYLPDFEIIEWNESNFDVNMNQYSAEAYRSRKYAFVSDFVRFYVLYYLGGIYLDVDVEVIRPIDQLLNLDAFTGFETSEWVAPGLILAAKPRHELIFELLSGYSNRSFITKDGSIDLTTIVKYTTHTLLKYGLVQNNQYQIIRNMAIFPSDYFAPKDVTTHRLRITKNTYSIHHYAASWHTRRQRIVKRLTLIFGVKSIVCFSRLIKIFRGPK